MVSPELHEYYRRIVRERRIEVLPPAAGIAFFHGRMTVILHREREFQVELMVTEPNHPVKPHLHPHVESILTLLAGEVYVELDGVVHAWPKPPRPNGTARDFMRRLEIPAGTVHGGHSGPLGACVLGVQRWLHGRVPGSVVDGDTVFGAAGETRKLA